MRRRGKSCAIVSRRLCKWATAPEPSHARTNQTAVPRRPCRQPDPARCADQGARAGRSESELPDAELKRIQHAAIREVVRLQEDLGLKARHRRRVQSHLVAPRFHAEVRQRAARSLQDEGALPYRRRRPRQQRAGAQGHRQAGAADGRRHLRRRLQVPGLDRARDAEDHHPVADRDAFPRRPRGDRRRSLSGHRGVLRRSRAALSRGDRRAGAGRLPLSADRRGQSRLSVRREAAPRRSPISARTRRRCRRPTPSCSTTRSATARAT